MELLQRPHKLVKRDVQVLEMTLQFAQVWIYGLGRHVEDMCDLVPFGDTHLHQRKGPQFGGHGLRRWLDKVMPLLHVLIHHLCEARPDRRSSPSS